MLARRGEPAADGPTGRGGGGSTPVAHSTPSAVRDRRIVRVLLASTLVRSAGRGTFMTVMSVHMTRFLGATVPQTGLVMTVGGLAGVAGAYGIGRLSDRVAARRILIALALVECVSFLGFAWSPTYLAVVPFVILFGPANLGSGAVRSVVIARDFRGSARVALRARTFLATNLGIGAGASLGAVALVSDDPTAPRAVLLSAAALYLAAAGISVRLPRTAGQVAGAESLSPTGEAPPRPSGDRRFLALVILTALFGTHVALLEVAMPLWVTLHTHAPRYLVTVLLVLNTALVLVLQMPVARRCVSVRQAGEWSLLGAVALAGGSLSMWAAHDRATPVAVTALVVAVTALTVGQVAVLTSTWTVSFELTPAAGAGAYQGLFTLGWQSGVMLGPVLVTTVAVTHGVGGWAGVSAPLLAAGVLLRILSGRLARDGVEA